MKIINIVWLSLILLVILVNVFHALAEYLTYLAVSGGYAIESNPLIATMINIQHNYIGAFTLTTWIIDRPIIIAFTVLLFYYLFIRWLMKRYNFKKIEITTKLFLFTFFVFMFTYLITGIIHTFKDFYWDYNIVVMKGGL